MCVSLVAHYPVQHTHTYTDNFARKRRCRSYPLEQRPLNHPALNRDAPVWLSHTHAAKRGLCGPRIKTRERAQYQNPAASPKLSLHLYYIYPSSLSTCISAIIQRAQKPPLASKLPLWRARHRHAERRTSTTTSHLASSPYLLSVFLSLSTLCFFFFFFIHNQRGLVCKSTITLRSYQNLNQR